MTRWRGLKASQKKRACRRGLRAIWKGLRSDLRGLRASCLMTIDQPEGSEPDGSPGRV